MAEGNALSDKGLAVFAFAAYHQLSTGGHVTEVVTSDGAGHRADPQAIEELQQAGLLSVDGGRAAFTPQGEAMLQGLVQALRRAASEAGAS